MFEGELQENSFDKFLTKENKFDEPFWLWGAPTYQKISIDIIKASNFYKLTFLQKDVWIFFIEFISRAILFYVVHRIFLF